MKTRRIREVLQLPVVTSMLAGALLSSPCRCSAFVTHYHHPRPQPAPSSYATVTATTRRSILPIQLLQSPSATQWKRRRRTRLQVTPPVADCYGTVGATLALAVSSLVGLRVQQWVPSGGILATLASAAMFGSFLPNWVPASHPLYDLCFSLFLPGSLTLLLLAYQPPPSSDKAGMIGLNVTTTATVKDLEYSIASCIRRTAAPFAIASIASLFGCWLSFTCAVGFRWFSAAPLLPSSSTPAQRIDREYARVVTGCLSASYVGGSVNCMATARLIGAPAELLGSMVTADLCTMAIYFAFLSSSLEWEWLVAKFCHDDQGNNEGGSDVAKDGATVTVASQTRPSSSSSPLTPSLRSKFLASIPLLLGTFGIVQIANRVEDVMGRFIPGTACAVIAVVAPLLNSRVLRSKMAREDSSWWCAPFSAAAMPLSDFFFLLFFASIGISANLSTALLSFGPACLAFSSLALTVHVVGTVLGCLPLGSVVKTARSRKRARRAGRQYLRQHRGVELEDVWIASNAAIGGPATAAAFCMSRMKGKGRTADKLLQGRTIAATVWGVVGYAIGTTLGVSMYRMTGS